jgi:hypothetical protein
VYADGTLEINMMFEPHETGSIADGNTQIRILNDGNVQMHLDNCARYDFPSEQPIMDMSLWTGHAAEYFCYLINGIPQKTAVFECERSKCTTCSMNDGTEKGTETCQEKHTTMIVKHMGAVEFADEELARMTSLHFLFRSMHITDYFIHISHGSCFDVFIIFTGSYLLINFSGRCLFTGSTGSWASKIDKNRRL